MELMLWNIPKYTAIICQFSVTKDLNGKGMMGGSAESGKQIPEHAHVRESKKNKSVGLVYAADC